MVRGNYPERTLETHKDGKYGREDKMACTEKRMGDRMPEKDKSMG